MSDQKASPEDIKKQVMARVEEEVASAPAQAKPQEKKIPLDFLRTCLFGNRVGDATLYAQMHRGKFVFVERWGRWLYWDGHHWKEDINSRRSLAAVERICEEYQRIIHESDDAEEGSDIYKLVRKRLNVLRDRAGRENLLDCAATIDDPLCIEGEELDKQEFLLACPNGVIDLRTGEAARGNPNSISLMPAPQTGMAWSQKVLLFLNFCGQVLMMTKIWSSTFCACWGMGYSGTEPTTFGPSSTDPAGETGRTP